MTIIRIFLLLIGLNAVCPTTSAHEPIFAIGPHVLYRGGLEFALDFQREKSNKLQENNLVLDLAYGITRNWTMGLGIPYVHAANGTMQTNDGIGDIYLQTKYRFWRNDTLGVQKSTAAFIKVIGSNGSTDVPQIGTDSTDAIVGMTYGYESRRWYDWISVRYRYSNPKSDSTQDSDKWLVDLVGGVRPFLTGYRSIDTVLTLEINWEANQKAKGKNTKPQIDLQNDPAIGEIVELDGTGGNAFYLTPGIYLTKRNISIKMGIQLPVWDNLGSEKSPLDFRYKTVLEYHL